MAHALSDSRFIFLNRRDRKWQETTRMMLVRPAVVLLHPHATLTSTKGDRGNYLAAGSPSRQGVRHGVRRFERHQPVRRSVYGSQFAV
jgi:hypothetical protein